MNFEDTLAQLIARSAAAQAAGEPDYFCETLARCLGWRDGRATMLDFDLYVEKVRIGWRWSTLREDVLVGAGIAESLEHGQALACAAASIEKIAADAEKASSWTGDRTIR